MNAVRHDVVQIKDALVEHERTIDVHLARITHLQKLIDLEEARLLRSQAQRQQLSMLLQSDAVN